MADFNTTLGSNNVTDYTGASKGYTDNALGGLFTDIAQGFDMGIKATDQFLQRRVADSARAMVEPLRDAAIGDVAGVAAGAPAGSDLGVGTYVDPETGEAPGGTPALPADAQAQFGRLSNIKQGVRAGSLSDSYYRSQLDVVSKKLRRMYPGYEDAIDNSLEKLTGSVPANKLLSDLQSQASAAMSSAAGAGNKIQSAWLKGVQDGLIDPNLYPLGKMTSIQDVAMIIAPKAKAKADLEIDNLNLANRDKNNAAYKDDTRVRSNNGASNIITGIMSDTHSLLGNKFTDLQTKIAKLDPSKPWDKNEMVELDAMTNQLVAGATAKLKGYYNAPFDEQGNTRASLLGPEETQKQIDAQVSRLTDWMGDLKEKNQNKLTHNAAIAKVWSEGDQAILLSDPDSLRLKSINESFGSTAAGLYLSSPEGAAAMGSMGVLSHDHASLGIANGEYQSLNQAINDSYNPKLTDSQRKAVGDNIVKTFQKAIADPQVPPVLKSRTIRAMYGDQNLGFVKQNLPMYTKMADPTTLANIKKYAEESGQPELWNMAKNWTLKTGTGLALTQAVQMQNAIVYNKYGVINYDTDSHSFTYVPTKEGINDPSLNSVQNLAVDTIERVIKTPAAKTAVATMNTMINGMATVFKLDNPKASEYDINSYVTNLTKSLGVDLGAAKQAPGTQSFFSSLNDAANKAFPEGALYGPNGFFRPDGNGGVQLTYTRNQNGNIVPRVTPGQQSFNPITGAVTPVTEQEGARQTYQVVPEGTFSAPAYSNPARGAGGATPMRLGGPTPDGEIAPDASGLAGSADAEALMGVGSQNPGQPSAVNSGASMGQGLLDENMGQRQMDARTGILSEMKSIYQMIEMTSDPKEKASLLEDIRSLQEEYRTLRQPAAPTLLKGPTPVVRDNKSSTSAKRNK